MLHIVAKSHTAHSALGCCLRYARPGDALLLTEDAVYAATAAGAASSGIAGVLQRLQVYALAPDLAARGVADRLAAGVATVDYAGFVDLVAAHPTNQSWL